jgi:hypothetical protein
MKWKGHFVAPRIDFVRYRDALHAELLEHLTLSAFVWLEATAPLIPRWSGASAATFLHLARQIGYSLPIERSSTAPFDRKQLGLRESESRIISEPARGVYKFTYRTTLDHLIFNEFNNANITHDPNVFSRLLTPGPYRFQEAGRNAFLRVAHSVRLPNPFRYLTRKVIRIR